MTTTREAVLAEMVDGMTLGFVTVTELDSRDHYEVRCGTCGHWTRDYASAAPAIRDHRKHAERKHGTT